MPVVECVPNFSEGRDRSVVDRIAAAITANVLDVSMDPDHNRSVITFAGSPDPVVESAVRVAGVAAESIDLRRHTGVHPRMGAIDVLPFVPLQGITMEECAALAARAGEEIWRRHRIPVYLYEAAARRPECRNLSDLRARVPELAPDIGGPGLHPTAGAVAAGARAILIAFNVNLDGANLDQARQIAQTVREASGGLPCVKALGLWLESRGLAQVSMNLTDYRRTPPSVAYEAVRRQAERLGVTVLESELIGLAPRAALDQTAASLLNLRDWSPSQILENAISGVS